MNKINREMKAFILIGILTIAFSSCVSAFAVSSAYYPENPLTLSPGESRDIQITLQNIGESEDVSVRADITNNSEIITITDASNIYLIPAEGKTKINARVSIPADIAIGGRYDVQFTFVTVTTGEAGAFGLGSSIVQNLPVVIEAPIPVKAVAGAGYLTYLIIAIIIVIIIIAIIIVMRRKKK